MALKNEILEILENNRTKDVSGQELAERLRVTRAAVWKAVKVLKADGHSIEAVRNRGYRLNDESDIISREGIKSELKHSCDVMVYRCVDSTNTTAKLAAVGGAPAGTVIIAEMQTGGKGRRGRSFYSPGEGGVYFSVILKPAVSAEESVFLTTAAAVAVSRAIERLTGKNAQIKWINDVYVDGRKCVGILTEAIFDYESGGVDSVIVGIGINVNVSDFPEEIKDKAGNIGKVSRNRLIALCVDNLMDICDDLPDISHLDEYRKRCFILGRSITVVSRGGKYEAKAESIDERGRLVVVYDGGKTAVLSNEEVSISLAKD